MPFLSSEYAPNYVGVRIASKGRWAVDHAVKARTASQEGVGPMAIAAAVLAMS